MRKSSLRSALGLAVVLCLPFTAAHAASAGKVEELLEVMDVKANHAQMQVMMARVFDDSFQAVARERGVTAEQAERLAASNERMKRTFLEVFTWEKLGPRYSALYQEILTDAEVDGALAYYRSPEGASMKAKTPLLMERSMRIGQELMMEALPKLRADLDKTMAEAAAAANRQE
jgi:hypothetical protein